MARAQTGIDDVLYRLVIQEDGCIVWPGSLKADGYGVTHLNGRYPVRVHRAVYEHLRGPLPKGKVLHHTCKNRACANPEHLVPMTVVENIRADHPDLWGKYQREKTHCLKGHEFTPENTYIHPNGTRHCKPCQLIRARDSKRRKKAREVADGSRNRR